VGELHNLRNYAYQFVVEGFHTLRKLAGVLGVEVKELIKGEE